MILTKDGFSILRDKFGSLTQGQVNELNFLVGELSKSKLSYAASAYVLATVWHETAKTMLPIKEYGEGKGRKYGTWYSNRNGVRYGLDVDGSAYLYSEFPHLYYGRGYVQLTWLHNFKKAKEKLGVDFVNNPDLVMQKDHAAHILIEGMREGWFTGKKLGDYIYQSKKDYVGARRIINGTDKAKLIAGYAEIFEKALRAK